jgi:hypothetical protein
MVGARSGADRLMVAKAFFCFASGIEKETGTFALHLGWTGEGRHMYHDPYKSIILYLSQFHLLTRYCYKSQLLAELNDESAPLL